MPITLRDYQERACDAIRLAFRSGKKAPLAVAPTGAGKTVIFSYISQQASARSNYVTIVAHRFELLAQISSALGRFGVEHGLICPGVTPNPLARVQVASVQALASRMKKRTFKTDLLVVDEAHHFLLSNSWGRVYAGLGEPPTIGVTASPVRGDGKGLGVDAGGIFDELIDVISVQDLLDQAYLVQPVVYAPAERLDLSGLRSRAGDYEREALAERIDKPMITGDAVAHYQRLCAGTPAVAFGVSIDHCQHIAAQFQAAGYRFEVVDGSMDDNVRKRLIAGLGKEITGLVSCDLIGEGVDIPAIGCAILLRPTQSLGLHIQQMGRALRPIYADGFDVSTLEGRRAALAAAGKTRAVILDHVGNTLVHGLAETPREWSLGGVKKKKGARKKDEQPELPVRQCEKCYAVFVPAPICPHCRHVQPTLSREVEQVEGELEEITPEMAAAINKQKRMEVGRARSLEELQRIGEERGYSPSWAEHVWRAKERAAQARAESQAAAYSRL